MLICALHAEGTHVRHDASHNGRPCEHFNTGHAPAGSRRGVLVQKVAALIQLMTVDANADIDVLNCNLQLLIELVFPFLTQTVPGPIQLLLD